MSKKVIARVVIAIVLLVLVIRFFTDRPQPLVHITGTTMGSIGYNIKYLDTENRDFKMAVDSLLIAFNQSLSTYIPESEISIINSQHVLENPGQLLLNVLGKSEEVWLATYGAFDPTIGPLVNAWGFGPDKRPGLQDSTVIDSLLQYVGFGKIFYADSVVKTLPGMYLDFSAIAKGYAVDIIADFLRRKNIGNFMVEIGGEVRVAGINEKAELWKIGIENPMVRPDEMKLLAIASLSDLAMATSGNYRNYYELEGRKIAHTIDPRTGYNVDNKILSATVFADDCMTADAYATAFMVLGFEPSTEIIKQSDLEAVLVYYDLDEIKVFVSSGIQGNIELVEDSNEIQ